MNNKRTMNSRYDYFDIFELIYLLLKRWWIILLVAIFGAAAMFAVSKYCITPLYQSSVLFYVNNGQQPEEKISNADISASQSLVDTYIVILKYGTTLDEAIADTGLDYTSDQLKKKIECKAIDDTEVFEVSVTDPSPTKAAKIAESIATILPEKVSSVIEGSMVRIVRNASVPTDPSSPNIRLNIILGALVCFVFCIIFFTLRYIMDNRIRNAAQMLKDHYPYPVLAVIPDLMSDPAGSYYYHYHAKEK